MYYQTSQIALRCCEDNWGKKVVSVMTKLDISFKSLCCVQYFQLYTNPGQAHEVSVYKNQTMLLLNHQPDLGCLL